MPGWHATVDSTGGGRCYRLFLGGEALSFRSLFELWEGSDAFCRWYTRLLSDANEPAYFWEHPPFVEASLDDGVEFVLTDAPPLARERPDPRPFAAHFAAAGDADVAVFENLGGDALLLAPCPRAASTAYPHLAAFVRGAPSPQVRALWQEAARAARRVAGTEPVWLSTSGTGVAWLHLRFDHFPKYYQHIAYKARR